MIEKIVSIKNYGKFKNFDVRLSDWDGTLKKTNVVYAPNGSGKTSLAVLFKSLSGDNDLIQKKKSFGSANSIEIKFIRKHKELKYSQNHWNGFIPDIEVFNSFYIDENIYSITIEDKMNSLNLFELSIANEIIDLKRKIFNDTKRKEKISKTITNVKRLVKKVNDVRYERRLVVLEKLKKEREDCIENIRRLQLERQTLTEKNRIKYIESVNKYLAMFCDNMCITNIKTAPGKQKQNLIYNIQIDNYEITLAERGERSLKYCLSDGDKNALSLSFFLARFDMIPNVKDFIVVIDDPFTSFDSQRKTTTVTQLSRLAAKVKQFFLLTHDMHFANDFNNSFTGELLNLKIAPFCKNEVKSSILCLHDIKVEMLSGLNKDLMTLRGFCESPKEDPLYLREVIRCIRPSIEGVFRIKYYSYIKDGEWLGDFIKRIRDSDASSPFFRLKDSLDEITEINDYCKSYHHSNPNYIEVGISFIELKNYVKRTLKLIEKI